MLKEKKFIIAEQYGRIKHFIFPSSHLHYNFSKDLGLAYSKIIETGLIVDKKIIVLECKDQNHLKKSNTELTPEVLKARETETRLAYRLIGLKEGD